MPIIQVTTRNNAIVATVQRRPEFLNSKMFPKHNQADFEKTFLFALVLTEELKSLDDFKCYAFVNFALKQFENGDNYF